MSKLCRSVMMAATTVLLAATFLPAAPGFVGTWVLDARKSWGASSEDATPTAMTIWQERNRLLIIEVIQCDGGKRIARHEVEVVGHRASMVTVQRNDGSGHGMFMEEWRVSGHGSRLCIRQFDGRKTLPVVFRRTQVDAMLGVSQR